MDAAALAAAGVNPSALAAQENGIIGAASIAAQLAAAVAAAEQASQNEKIMATYAAIRAKEAADLAAASKSTIGNTDMMKFKSKGGMISPLYRPMGGLIPYFLNGGFAKGTDTVPAMLTPGEFVMSKYAVDAHGINTMKSINKGQSVGGTVYNNTYELTVNARTDANPNEIAQAVMSTIKNVEGRRIRGVSLNGR